MEERLRRFTVVVSLTAGSDLEIDPEAIREVLEANAGGDARHFDVPHEPNEHIWELVFVADDWRDVLHEAVEYAADALAAGSVSYSSGTRIGVRIVDVQPLDDAEIGELEAQGAAERTDAHHGSNDRRDHDD